MGIEAHGAGRGGRVGSDENASARDRGPRALTVGGACAGIVLVTLLVSGATVGEVFLFLAFQGAYALVPGLVSNFALLERPRSLVDALAVAWALGLALQIGCFVLAAAVGQRWFFTAFPLALLLAAAPLLWRRRTSLSWPLPASLRSAVSPMASGVAVSVSVLASLVVFLALFAPSPLPRAIQSASYYPDLISNVSLAAELLHHWPFMSPSVSGVALHYNIFTNVDMAATAQVTHLALANIVMRLQPAFLVGVIAVQLYALGRKVGGSPAAGWATLVLGLFAGELNFSQIDLAGGGIPVLGGLYSASYQIGAVFFLAIAIVLVERLRPARRGSRSHEWLALAILTLGATGAKASVLPVLAGGLALFVIGQALARRSSSVGATTREGVGALAIVLAAGALGYVLVYRGGGHGQTLEPLDFLSYTGFASLYRHASHSPAYLLALCAAAAATVCWLLASLLGAVFVRDRWWPRSSCSSPERLLMCMLVASIVPFALFAVPGDSEVYYIVYGFLAASVVSAAGLTSFLRTLRPSRRDAIRAGLPCALAVPIVVLALRAERSPAALVPAYAVLAAAVALSAARLGRRLARTAAGARGDALAAGAVIVICLTAVSESVRLTSPTIGRWLDGAPAYAASGSDTDRGITADLLKGLLWVRDHTSPSAVIAVNNHELGGDGGSNYYYYSAFTERRVFLESWEETPQGYRYLSLGRSGSPFPRLLAINNAALLRGSRAAISLLHDRYGVRYIVIDRLHGPASAKLARLAHLVYENPAVAVFRIE